MQELRIKEKERSLQSSDVNSIQHIVSKRDTLAGLAIKYGVEVADVKRLNGLVTDHQMFALRSLQIPVPGRHPPSPVATNSPAGNRTYDDALDPFSSPKHTSPRLEVTPAMRSLHDYYGLARRETSSAIKDPEIAAPYGVEPAKISLLICDAHHRRTKSLAVLNLPRKDEHPNGVANKSLAVLNLPRKDEHPDGVAIDIDGDGKVKKPNSAKAVRRRQKADADSIFFTSEAENAGVAMDRDMNRSTSVVGAPLKDSVRVNLPAPVRRASSTSNLSTSNLRESDGGNNSTMWATSLRPMKPDGFPRPMNNARRSKAALD